MFRNRVERFSIRKLSVGAASILIGVFFVSSANQVKADVSASSDMTAEVATKDVVNEASDPQSNVNNNHNNPINETSTKDDLAQSAATKDDQTNTAVKVQNTVESPKNEESKNELDVTKKDTSTIEMNSESKDESYSAIFGLGSVTGTGIVLQGAAENISNGQVLYTTNANTDYYFEKDGKFAAGFWQDSSQIKDWSEVKGVVLINDPGKKASAQIQISAKLDSFKDSATKKLSNYTKDSNGKTSSADSIEYSIIRTIKYEIFYKLSKEDIVVSKDHPYQSDVDLIDPVVGYGKSGDTIPFDLPDFIKNEYGQFRFAGLFLNQHSGQGDLATESKTFTLGKNNVVVTINYKLAQPSDVVRNIKDYYQGDDKEPKETTQIVRFVERIYAVDNNSKLEQVWNYSIPSITGWGAYNPIGRDGYTTHIYKVDKNGTKTEISSIDPVKIQHDDPSVNIEIHYVKNDNPDTPITPDKPTDNPTPDEPDTNVTPQPQTPETNKPEDNNVVPHASKNDEKKPNKDTPVKEAVPVHVVKAATVEEERATLPQTGEKTNAAGIFGILAAVLGMFGMSVGRKRN